MIAKLAQQCATKNGNQGSFLFIGDSPATGEVISPVFRDTADLFAWCRAHGWIEIPGTFAGQYEKS